MKVYPADINDILIIEPRVFKDARGFFKEIYHQSRYHDAWADSVFVQDNHSHSLKGVLRGLHYQLKGSQGKLICVVRGEIFDVAVDIRLGSPSFGKWFGCQLSEENHRQLFIPKGFAHGFCVLSEEADVIYKCTDFYRPDDEYGIRWDDPQIGIAWKVKEPVLSEKDAGYPFLSGVPEKNLPVWKCPDRK